VAVQNATNAVDIDELASSFALVYQSSLAGPALFATIIQLLAAAVWLRACSWN